MKTTEDNRGNLKITNMYKIRKVYFKEHPILDDLTLDFCGQDGHAVGTVIIAGENGTGKSTVLNELYDSIYTGSHNEVKLELENDDGEIFFSQRKRKSLNVVDIYITDTDGNEIESSKISLAGIYSDAEIDYNSKSVKLNASTSLDLDTNANSRRSNKDMVEQIKQLIIDIQGIDDANIAKAYYRAVEGGLEFGNAYPAVERRMPRFTSAFEGMFKGSQDEGLQYYGVENYSGHKEIFFTKNGKRIPIDDLSSGEKQIVYRGCFMLRDISALRGAFVFIDEPEMCLHPRWQQRVMNYYKGIFSNERGIQTSQIIVATHSPFIIHNKNRFDDKVIVLTRDQAGNIAAMDKPEYYRCDSVAAVEDAFSIKNFLVDRGAVYLEGKTDKKYFDRALEVYGYKGLDFEFSCTGYDDNGSGVNYGVSALNRASEFMIGQNNQFKSVFLYDWDANKADGEKNNVYIRSLKKYNDGSVAQKGVENALIINDEIDVSSYYYNHDTETEAHGKANYKMKLDKNRLCDVICALSDEALVKIFVHLKEEIDELIKIFNDD